MLDALNVWIRNGNGTATVAIRLSNSSTYSPYILRAADALGIVVSPLDRPTEIIGYPWQSVFGITNRTE